MAKINTLSAAVAAAILFAGMAVGFLPMGDSAWAADAPAPAAPAPAAAAAPAAPAAAAPVAEPTFTPEQLAAGLQAWKDADCANCHGWSGNGKDTGPVPPGPSLRDTGLDYDGIKETIQCGRPGTNMPAHDRLAYVDDRCYGMKAADLGKDKPRVSMALQPQQIADIAAYVAGVLKGKGPTTFAQCEAYKGTGSPACTEYKGN